MRCFIFLLIGLFTALGNMTCAQVQVKDIQPGAGSSNPYLFYQFNGKFLFCANDGFHRNQVYISDGTNAGTTMLTNLPYTASTFGPDGSIPLGGTSISPGSSGGNFHFYNNKYYFIAVDDSANYGASLWMTDGTVSGTVQIDTFTRGMVGCSHFFILKNTLGESNLCTVYQKDSTYLYRYNLTTNTGSSIPLGPFNSYYINGILGQSHNWTNAGISGLWQGSGNVNNPSFSGWSTYSIGPLTYPWVFQEKFYVITRFTDSMFSIDVSGNKTFVYQFPFRVYTSTSGGDLGDHTFIGNKMIIYPDSTSQPFGKEPHVYDFLTNSCSLLKDINPYFNNSSDCKFFHPDYPNSYSKIYFKANDADHGDELWVTDGSSIGTKRITDVSPGTASSFPGSVQYLGNNFYFGATHPTLGPGLYRTTGDSATTTRLYFQDSAGVGFYMWHDIAFNRDVTIKPGEAYYPNRISVIINDTVRKSFSYNDFSCLFGSRSSIFPTIKVGNFLYFAYNDCNTGNELYKLDLTSSLFIPTEDYDVLEDVSIYPNPTSDNFFIRSETKFSVTVYDMFGRIVKDFSKFDQLSLSDCTPGTYIVKLFDSKRNENRMLILFKK